MHKINRKFDFFQCKMNFYFTHEHQKWYWCSFGEIKIDLKLKKSNILCLLRVNQLLQHFVVGGDSETFRYLKIIKRQRIKVFFFTDGGSVDRCHKNLFITVPVSYIITISAAVTLLAIHRMTRYKSSYRALY